MKNQSILVVVLMVFVIAIGFGCIDQTSGKTNGAGPSVSTPPPPAGTTNPTVTPPTQPPERTSSNRTIRIYVSGESIERRNRFLTPPFSPSGTLNDATNSDSEYGWMIPLMDRLKLRSPGLEVQFVGSGQWLGYDDSPYSGTYPSTTALDTSALSGMSTDNWLANKQSELESQRFCYDIALIDRGGNDGWMDTTDRKNYIEQVALLASSGSSCNVNPTVYVIAHMPDQFSTNQAPAYQNTPRTAVIDLNTQYPTKNIRFVDVYGSFYGNVPTTAFPRPTWRTDSGFDFESMLLSGDSGHPARLASIYFGEIVANSIDLSSD